MYANTKTDQQKIDEFIATRGVTRIDATQRAYTNAQINAAMMAVKIDTQMRSA